MYTSRRGEKVDEFITTKLTEPLQPNLEKYIQDEEEG